MNEAPKCDCCHTADAEYVVTQPTDACERGVLYCATCAVETSAGMERIRNAEEGDETLRGGEIVQLDSDKFGIIAVAGSTGRYAVRLTNGRAMDDGGMRFAHRRSDFRVIFEGAEISPAPMHAVEVARVAVGSTVWVIPAGANAGDASCWEAKLLSYLPNGDYRVRSSAYPDGMGQNVSRIAVAE